MDGLEAVVAERVQITDTLVYCYNATTNQTFPVPNPSVCLGSNNNTNTTNSTFDFINTSDSYSNNTSNNNTVTFVLTSQYVAVASVDTDIENYDPPKARVRITFPAHAFQYSSTSTFKLTAQRVTYRPQRQWVYIVIGLLVGVVCLALLITAFCCVRRYYNRHFPTDTQATSINSDNQNGSNSNNDIAGETIQFKERTKKRRSTTKLLDDAPGEESVV